MNQLWLWCCNILPIPRPRHADAALAAIALAVEKQQAIGETLIALGNSDPSLSTWAKRLAPRFQAGEDIEDILLGHRLIRLDECRYIRGETPQHISAGLRALSARTAQRIPPLLLLRWFPTLFILVTVMALGGLQALFKLLGHDLGQIYVELAIDLPKLTAIAFNPDTIEKITVLGGAVIFVIVFQLVMQRMGELRILPTLTNVKVFRLWYALRLLHYGKNSEYLNENEGRPAWYWDFHCWWQVSRSSLSDKQQKRRPNILPCPSYSLPSELFQNTTASLTGRQPLGKRTKSYSLHTHPSPALFGYSY